jgi:hypothetical protein
MKTENNACVLIISNRAGLLKIAHMLNGKLRTPKIYLSILPATRMAGLQRAFSPSSAFRSHSSWYNAWFAGFTEADGGFMVRLTEPGGHRAETKRGHMLYVYHRTAADPP